MEKIMDKMELMWLKAKNAWNGFAKDEKGDTNFISIIIVLGIILVVAVAFIAFRKRIMSWFTDTTETFFEELGE